MSVRNILSSLAAIGLVTGPVAAQAAGQPALPRTASPVGDAENFHGGFIVPLLALAAVILGILVLTSDDDEDLPHSP